MRGYRGLARELARTGSKALWLQVRTGALHFLSGLFERQRSDGVERFLEHYEADGFRLRTPRRRELALAAERCLVCGRCSIECARVGGDPGLDPEEAVVAASRLELDWQRLGRGDSPESSPCGGCRACHGVCPVSIPIAEIQLELVQLAPDILARRAE
jgi:succinate dehydrogenase/fumarate reductase-like Fe-S protein